MALAVFIGILASALLVRSFFLSDIEKEEEEVRSHAMLYQVPLEETEVERQAFIDEFVQIEGYDLRDLYEEWIDVIGANGLIESLHEVYPTCHDRAHDLGKVIYARSGDMSSSLATCEDACYSGCFHGVLMEAFTIDEPLYPNGELGEWDPGQHVELEDVKEKANEMCNDNLFSARKGAYSAGDCAHGVGHALQYLANYDIDTAINLCDSFEDPGMRYYCTTGVYMEYVVSGMDWDAPDQQLSLSPCTDHAYPAACFRYRLIPYAYYHYNQADLNMLDFRKVCQELEGSYRAGCFSGFGIAHMELVRNETLTLGQVCSLEDDDDAYMCIEPLAEKIAKTYPDIAATQCLTLPDDWRRDICLRAVDGGFYNLDKDFTRYER